MTGIASFPRLSREHAVPRSPVKVGAWHMGFGGAAGRACLRGRSALRWQSETEVLQLQPEQAVMKTILSNARLIDCVEPTVRPDTAVLIEDGRIRAILPSVEAGTIGDAQTIDLNGAYLMPGLWDVHIHP